MAKMWKYDGTLYTDTEQGRFELVMDVLYHDDLTFEMDKWADKEFCPHEIMGMLWDASTYKSKEDIQDALIEWFAQDLADDPDFIEEYGTLVEEEEVVETKEEE